MADAVRATLADAASRLGAAFAQAAAPTAVTALWQGAAVAVALALCLRLAPRVSAAYRFFVWAAGFAVAAGLPFLPWLAPASRTGVAAPAPAGAHLQGAWFQLDARWGFVIAAMWLALSALRVAQLGGHLIRLRGLLNSATPVEPGGSLRLLLDRVSPARRCIAISTASSLDRPCVVGFFAPRILIPDWLFDRLTPEELEQLVLHEAEHLRRGDDWSNLAQKLALAVFPLNPALAWIERRLCREREMACDEGVVSRTQAPNAYAACLASVAERGLERRDLLRRAHALSLGAFERRPELVRRVHSILWNKRTLHPAAARALTAVVACGLLAGAIELARSPRIVAFVSAPSADAQTATAVQAQDSPGSGERAQNADSQLPVVVPGYRSVKTKAILPDSRNVRAPIAAAPSRSVKRPATGSDAEVAYSRSAPRPELTAAQMTASAEAPEPQIVVFTAWEETPRQAARAVADYDIGAEGDGPRAAAADQRSSEPPVRITVTRWIFAVYPANQPPAPPTSGARTPRTTDSHFRRLPAPPVDGGWLVFEL